MSSGTRVKRAPIREVPQSKYKLPLDLMRDNQRKEEKCLYPFIQRLDVKTQGQSHLLNIKSDDIIRMIILGVINKNLAAQYCHYLADQIRQGVEKDFYSDKCFELSTYLLKNHTEIPEKSLYNLLCDVADTSSRNCISVCDRLERLELLERITSSHIEVIFGALYKFNLWDKANHLIQLVSSDKINEQLVECVTRGIINSVKECNKLHDEDDKKRARRSILKHLIYFVQLCSDRKVHFLTQFRDDFINSLKDLDLKISIDPVIKRTGRCVVCSDHLRLHPNEATTKLNQLIGDVLTKGSDGGLFYFTTPKELSRFQEYLKNLKISDKDPIDVVIDGLNTAYKNSTGFNYYKQEIDGELTRTIKKHRTESLVQVLLNTIIRSNMLHDYKRILIIGKHHMMRWPGLMEFVQKYKIHFFAPTDNSEDDLFQLYAATLHPKTQLVSNDYFRDHMSRIKDSAHKKEMLEWLDTHQVWIQRDNLKALWPTPFAKFPNINRGMKTMHLPIVDYNLIGPGDPPLHINNKALKWVCCRYDHIDTEAEPLFDQTSSYR